MNVGLLYTPVSIYQMTRGALVLFVGTFSVIFLRRRLWLYQFRQLFRSNLILISPSSSQQMDLPHSRHDRRCPRRLQRLSH